MAVNPGPTRDDIWRQYELDVGLFRHYLELTVKFNIFYYAITGAILSFYLSRPQPPSALRYSLLLPVIMGIGLAAICIYGGFLNLTTRQNVMALVGALGLPVYPEFLVLSVVLWVSAGLFLVVAAGIGILFVWPYLRAAPRIRASTKDYEQAPREERPRGSLMRSRREAPR